MSPELALSIEGESKDIAMTERPHLRAHAALVSKWIVIGYAAIVIEAHDLAQVRLHVLCRIEFLALARTDPQHAVAIERNAMTEVAAAAFLWYLTPDHFEIF